MSNQTSTASGPLVRLMGMDTDVHVDVAQATSSHPDADSRRTGDSAPGVESVFNSQRRTSEMPVYDRTGRLLGYPVRDAAGNVVAYGRTPRAQLWSPRGARNPAVARHKSLFESVKEKVGEVLRQFF